MSEDRCAGVDAERLEGIALILRAIDMTIAELESREDADEGGEVVDLLALRYMRERWREKAAEETRAVGDAGRLGGGESRA